MFLNWILVKFNCNPTSLMRWVNKYKTTTLLRGKLNQDTNDIYQIICEYSYHLDGYVKNARADILIKK